jgi:hypothetical protein
LPEAFGDITRNLDVMLAKITTAANNASQRPRVRPQLSAEEYVSDVVAIGDTYDGVSRFMDGGSNHVI